jgi:hypothetical protein
MPDKRARPSSAATVATACRPRRATAASRASPPATSPMPASKCA